MLQLQPHLQAWEDRGFEVYFVTPAAAQDVEKYMETRKVRMDVLLDPTRAFEKKYNIKGYPTSVIVDHQGIIRDIKVGWGGQSLQQLINLVNQLCPEG